MKTKFILGSLALASAFVGCSNEELNVVANENQSNLIELSENFMISSVGVAGVESRTHWALENSKLTNVFAPVVAAAGEGNNVLNGMEVIAPSIGLCWIGQTPGAQVYTNYEFIHNGWLADGAKAPLFDICDSDELKNGWLYSEVTTSTTYAEGTELDDELTVTAKGESNEYDELELNSGVYKTHNKAIFGGQYIAYYPYNPNFINAGTIPVASDVVFDNVTPNNLETTAVAENTFRYSKVTTIDGGAKASGFEFENLSGILRISLKNNVNSAATTNVEKIILYSPSASIKKEVRLSASAIAAGKEGADLYAETVETSKTILINMISSAPIMAKNEANVTANSTFISVLPQTISDLVVLAYDEGDNKWAEYTVGNVVIPEGGAVDVVATIKDADFKSVFYAVDQATLTTALAEAYAAGTVDEPATVKVLGDIDVTAPYTWIGNNVIVEGDALNVVEGAQLEVSGTVKSDITVEGKSCCSSDATYAGYLILNGATIEGNVTLEKGYGNKQSANLNLLNESTIAATSTVLSEGVITAQTGNTYILNIAGTFTTNNNFTVNEGSVVNSKGATLTNNGTIEVEGEFNVLDASGATVAAAGEKFTNNGTFIDNVGAIVGGATQYMINNGDYICKVHSQARLDEAYTNKLASNIIEFVNETGVDYNFTAVAKHNNKDVDLVINAAVGFATTVDATLGNVEVKAGKALYIHKSVLVSGSTTNYAEITINGNINNNGNIFVREDVRNLKANNFTVNKDAAVQFANRNTFNGKTMAVSGTIEVKKGGTFTIDAKTANKNIALVTCTKLIEGGTFNGKPEVVR